MQIPFKIVADACVITETNIILIGGHALGVYGYHRGTLDIDFLITEKDYKKAKKTICAAGYSEMVHTNVAAKLRAESDALIDIDFIFVDQETFQKVKQDSKLHEYIDCSILVPKPEHLIAMKLHAIRQQPKIRELKDLNDIVELIKACNINAAADEFKSMCLKFGTKTLYEKILKYTDGARDV